MDPQASSLDLHANHDREIYGTVITFMILAIVAVSLRFFTVLRLKRQQPAVDDYMVAVALLITLAEGISTCVLTKSSGIGRHVALLQARQLKIIQKGAYAIALLHSCSLALTKLAVLRLFYQIFITRPYRLAILFMSLIVIVWWFGNFFAYLLICVPIQYNWDQTIRGAHCGNRQLLHVLTPIPWIITDLTILLLPIPMTWSLQMPLKQKVAVSGTFLLGGLSLVSSLVRYRFQFYSNNDLTWTLVPLVICNVLEVTFTVIAACLLVLRPLFNRIFDSKVYPCRDGQTYRDRNLTNENLTDRVRALFTHIHDAPSTTTRIDSEKQVKSITSRQDEMAGWNDLEAMELQDMNVLVTSTVDVIRN